MDCLDMTGVHQVMDALLDRRSPEQEGGAGASAAPALAAVQRLRPTLERLRRAAAAYPDYALLLEVGVVLDDEELSAWAFAGALTRMRTIHQGEATADRLERLASLTGHGRPPWFGEVVYGLRNPLRRDSLRDA